MDFHGKQQKKYLILITFAIVLFTVMQNVSSVLSVLGMVFRLLTPFIMGLCAAFIFNVPLTFIEDRILVKLSNRFPVWRKLKRPVGILLTLCFVLGLVLALLLLIIPEIIKTFDIIANNMPGYLETAGKWVEDMAAKFEISIDNIQKIEIDWAQINSTVADFVKNGGASIFNTTLNVTTGILNGLVNVLMCLIFSIYILYHKESLARQIKKTVYAYLPERINKKTMEIGSLANRIFSNFVSGQMTEAVLIGVLCFIGMTILLLPYSVMISALVGFTALIPVFGAFIGTAVGAFLILMISPLQAVIFVIFIIILQQFEGNVIYPKVVGKSVGLPGMWVLLAVLVGGNLYGAVGMLVSVPLCSLLYSILRSGVEERIRKKNLVH